MRKMRWAWLVCVVLAVALYHSGSYGTRSWGYYGNHALDMAFILLGIILAIGALRRA